MELLESIYEIECFNQSITYNLIQERYDILKEADDPKKGNRILSLLSGFIKMIGNIITNIGKFLFKTLPGIVGKKIKNIKEKISGNAVEVNIDNVQEDKKADIQKLVNMPKTEQTKDEVQKMIDKIKDGMDSDTAKVLNQIQDGIKNHKFISIRSNDKKVYEIVDYQAISQLFYKTNADYNIRLNMVKKIPTDMQSIRNFAKVSKNQYNIIMQDVKNCAKNASAFWEKYKKDNNIDIENFRKTKKVKNIDKKKLKEYFDDLSICYKNLLNYVQVFKSCSENTKKSLDFIYKTYKNNTESVTTDNGDKKTIDNETGEWYDGDELIQNAIKTVSKLYKSEILCASDMSKLLNIGLDNIMQNL